ncbi:MAG: metallophosphoesterase family protein [Alphaproteobacteria bacterium]|nr:metallophosphoesterase family protein [Alphaproteobacteria bacterium]
MHRSLLLLPLLAACDFYPDPVDDSHEAPTIYGACDPEILIPVGVLEDAPEDPAEPHAETFGAEPEPYAVRYQWPSRDPSTSAGFLWRTDVDTLASQLRIGPAEGFPDNAEVFDGASFLFGGGEVGQGNYRIHEARLCDSLEPATAYSYQVGGSGHWSDTFTFTTPGSPGSFDTFRVAISGDSRGAYQTWNELLTAMDSHEPDFFIFSGDMVEFGSTQSEWDAWFEASADFFARKAFVGAHGNHEFLAQHYFAQFAFPGNEEWFPIEYGDLLLMSLNDTVRDAEQVETEQVRFMEDELSGTSARWKVAMHHQPVYSTCTRHGSKESLRDTWVPVWDTYSVDFVFAGHNHIYERSVPIAEGREVPDGQGTVYFVSGGAGAPLYQESESEWFGSVANPIVHYIIADFSSAGVDLTVYDLDGNVIDSYSVAR